MAARALWKRGEGPRRGEERFSWGRDVVREILRQRGVAAQLSLLQRDLDNEAQSFTETLLAGADEGVEISSDWDSRQGGLARAHDVSENH